MSQPTQLATLEQQLLQLAKQASRIDEAAPAWQRRDWFDSELFQCHSPQLLDYVQEAMQLLKRLQGSLQQRSQQPSQQRSSGDYQLIQQQNQQRLAVKLAAQMQALSRAFACLDIRKRENGKWRPAKAAKTAATAPQRHKAGQLLAELGGTHQALYQKLSETHEFERRLLQMIHEAAQQQQAPELQLALHARLGRCRKAISQLEAEIQWLEQKRER
ncbi:primosomal replication protein [Rheinheimera sp. 4Y26]|uniref:primosomal replication protein n=1 Tax=Rheinheimera sp. 4Y26 TaxID=2977811 RepID=UPI0021B0931F|nr:primosomal replication protein [Rheinheimera sp. 4Y26]MCT6700110.1 primosomal replication protein [Rheinheimera sp. 4Y26]